MNLVLQAAECTLVRTYGCNGNGRTAKSLLPKLREPSLARNSGSELVNDVPPGNDAIDLRLPGHSLQEALRALPLHCNGLREVVHVQVQCRIMSHDHA